MLEQPLGRGGADELLRRIGVERLKLDRHRGDRRHALGRGEAALDRPPRRAEQPRLVETWPPRCRSRSAEASSIQCTSSITSSVGPCDHLRQDRSTTPCSRARRKAGWSSSTSCVGSTGTSSGSATSGSHGTSSGSSFSIRSRSSAGAAPFSAARATSAAARGRRSRASRPRTARRRRSRRAGPAPEPGAPRPAVTCPCPARRSARRCCRSPCAPGRARPRGSPARVRGPTNGSALRSRLGARRRCAHVVCLHRLGIALKRRTARARCLEGAARALEHVAGGEHLPGLRLAHQAGGEGRRRAEDRVGAPERAPTSPANTRPRPTPMRSGRRVVRVRDPARGAEDPLLVLAGGLRARRRRGSACRRRLSMSVSRKRDLVLVTRPVGRS